MKSGETVPDDRDARAEATDPVWHLLGRSPLPEPDAWFTIRAMAQCRHAGRAAAANGWSLAHVWRWALGTGCALSLAIFLAVRIHHIEVKAISKQKNVQEAFEIMASMPDSDSSTVPASPSWQDSSY
jgi:hypothetical protein